MQRISKGVPQWMEDLASCKRLYAENMELTAERDKLRGLLDYALAYWNRHDGHDAHKEFRDSVRLEAGL